MEYKYIESTNKGLVEEKLFTTKKEARQYLNSKVKLVKAANKNWKTYFTNSSQYFAEKELRLASDIKNEELGKIDLGEEGFPFYAFELTYIGE